MPKLSFLPSLGSGFREQDQISWVLDLDCTCNGDFLLNSQFFKICMFAFHSSLEDGLLG
jgi:hypothetical protein